LLGGCLEFSSPIQVLVLTLLCVVSTESISRGISLSIAITSGDRQLDAVQVASMNDAPTTSSESGKLRSKKAGLGKIKDNE
jgi:hypothetical protein